jgi:hypothetical protein
MYRPSRTATAIPKKYLLGHVSIRIGIAKRRQISANPDFRSGSLYYVTEVGLKAVADLIVLDGAVQHEEIQQRLQPVPDEQLRDECQDGVHGCIRVVAEHRLPGTLLQHY